jgi:hypothetical protein
MKCTIEFVKCLTHARVKLPDYKNVKALIRIRMEVTLRLAQFVVLKYCDTNTDEIRFIEKCV